MEFEDIVNGSKVAPSNVKFVGALWGKERDQMYQSVDLFVMPSVSEPFGLVALEHGLMPLTSATNFLTIDCSKDGDFARRVLAELLARDIFVRMPGVAPLDRCIRVSLGGVAELAAFSAALPAALAAAKG